MSIRGALRATSNGLKTYLALLSRDLRHPHPSYGVKVVRKRITRRFHRKNVRSAEEKRNIDIEDLTRLQGKIKREPGTP